MTDVEQEWTRFMDSLPNFKQRILKCAELLPNAEMGQPYVRKMIDSVMPDIHQGFSSEETLLVSSILMYSGNDSFVSLADLLIQFETLPQLPTRTNEPVKDIESLLSYCESLGIEEALRKAQHLYDKAQNAYGSSLGILEKVSICAERNSVEKKVCQKSSEMLISYLQFHREIILLMNSAAETAIGYANSTDQSIPADQYQEIRGSILALLQSAINSELIIRSSSGLNPRLYDAGTRSPLYKGLVDQVTQMHKKTVDLQKTLDKSLPPNTEAGETANFARTYGDPLQMKPAGNCLDLIQRIIDHLNQ